jgi:hypothetical protein
VPEKSGVCVCGLPLKITVCAGLVCGIPSLTVGALKGLGVLACLKFRGPLGGMFTPLKVEKKELASRSAADPDSDSPLNGPMCRTLVRHHISQPQVESQ